MYELKTLFSIIDFSTKNIVSLIKFLCDELACCKFEAWIIDIIDRIDTDTIVKIIINMVHLLSAILLLRKIMIA